MVQLVTTIVIIKWGTLAHAGKQRRLNFLSKEFERWKVAFRPKREEHLRFIFKFAFFRRRGFLKSGGDHRLKRILLLQIFGIFSGHISIMSSDLFKRRVVLSSTRDVDRGRGIVPRHRIAEYFVFGISDRLRGLKSIESCCLFRPSY